MRMSGQKLWPIGDKGDKNYDEDKRLWNYILSGRYYNNGERNLL